MSTDQSEHEHGIPAKHPGDRLQHESTLIDQRPREKKRDAAAWALWALGVLAGGAAFALGLWIYAMIAGRHYSAFPYLLCAAIGAGVLPGILPYLSLARSDGADANVVRSRGRRGQADTPIEGAQAADTGSAAERADGTYEPGTVDVGAERTDTWHSPRGRNTHPPGQQLTTHQPVGATMSDDHPKAEPDEDEYGKVETGDQPEPKPASGEPVKSDAFAHANDDD